MFKKNTITRPDVDFIAPAKLNQTTRLLLGVIVIICLCLLWKITRTQQQLTSLDQQFSKSAHNTPASIKTTGVDIAQIKQNHAALQKVQNQLTRDLSLLQWLDSCTQANWQYATISPDFSKNTVLLQINTQNTETLNTGINCLKESGAVKETELISQSHVQNSMLPLQIKLVGRW